MQITNLNFEEKIRSLKINSGVTQCLNEGLMFLSIIYLLVHLPFVRGEGSIFTEHPMSLQGHAILRKLHHGLWRVPVKWESMILNCSTL